MQEYAGCVETLHPQALGADMVIVLKVLFVVALAGAAFAVWKERQGSYTDLGSQAMVALLGFLAAPAALAAVGGVLLGIWWLFT